MGTPAWPMRSAGMSATPASIASCGQRQLTTWPPKAMVPCESVAEKIP
ncbi:hypothetical protein [Aeromicrobium sp. UC242_57]